MSEQSLLPAPDHSAGEGDPPTPSQEKRRSELLPWLSGLGFIVLAVAILYVWQHPPAPPASQQTELATLQNKIASIDARLGQVEQQPAPPSAADLGKLSTRLDALEARISDQTQFASHIDSLSGRIEAVAAHDQTSTDAMKQQLQSSIDAVKQQLQSSIDAVKQPLGGMATQIASLGKASNGLDAIASQVSRIGHVQAAALALAAGQPLGNIPNAPPALARYAAVAPPTEGQLRLMFPQIEREAIAANQSSTADGPLLNQVWERAEDLVTVRRGGEVISGNNSVMALAQTRAALDAGDLSTAVKALSTASPTVLRVAADWLAQAKALLAAQAALADMASHT